MLLLHICRAHNFYPKHSTIIFFSVLTNGTAEPGGVSSPNPTTMTVNETRDAQGETPLDATCLAIPNYFTS